MEAISNVLSALKTLKNIYQTERIHEMFFTPCWRFILSHLCSEIDLRV